MDRKQCKEPRVVLLIRHREGTVVDRPETPARPKPKTLPNRKTDQCGVAPIDERTTGQSGLFAPSGRADGADLTACRRRVGATGVFSRIFESAAVRSTL